jgi:hypothetical protein
VLPPEDSDSVSLEWSLGTSVYWRSSLSHEMLSWGLSDGAILTYHLAEWNHQLSHKNPVLINAASFQEPSHRTL